METNLKKPLKVSDVLWSRIVPLLPRRKWRPNQRGRPPRDDRDVLDAVLWILKTGAQWSKLPCCYPPKSTVHDRFQVLVARGFFGKLFKFLGQELESAGVLDLAECYIDGMFILAKKGKEKVGFGKKGKGSKAMVVAEKHGLPAAVHIDSAAPHEVTLVNKTLEASITASKPEHLVGDAAYDSDSLDKSLKRKGIEMIAPHKVNRVKEISQDGRALRRYKRRYRIERFNAWIQSFRRLVVRYEYKLCNYLALFQMGCILILEKYL